MKKVLEILAGSIAAGLAAKLYPEVDKIVTPATLALLVTSVGSSITFVLLRTALLLPMRLPQLRRYFDQVYGIEGYWLQHVEDEIEHPFSFAWIEYDPESGCFTYNGRNFTSEMMIHARWHSQAIVTDGSSDRVHFLFEADLTKGAESIRGHGTLVFSHRIGRLFSSASGSYVDSGSVLRRSTFAAERVSQKRVKEVLGQSRVTSDDDIKKLLSKLVVDKGWVPDQLKRG